MAPPPITAKRFTTDQIITLWSNARARFLKSRQRIAYCQGVERGDHGVVRPDLDPNPDGTPGDPADDPLTTTLAQRLQIPLGMINRFAGDVPVIERRPIGATPTARRDAELLGTWLNTAIEATMDVEECYGKGVEDAEYAVVVVPSTAHFQQSPDFFDTIEAGAYDKLDAAGQAAYTEYEGKYARVDGKGRKVVAGQWKRDTTAAAKRAWEEAKQAYLASIPPWVVRIVPALDCAPILVPGRGKKRFECRGLIIRTLYNREDLLADHYLWQGHDQALLVPADYNATNTYGANGQIYLYEAFLMLDGHPVVAYSVGGLGTTGGKGGGPEVDAVVDLAEEYGLCRLHVHYAYGLHTSSDNPDQRGVPVLYPLAKTLVGAESLLTATNVHAWKNSHAGYYLPIAPDAPQEAYLEQSGQLRKFSVPGSGEVLVVPGLPVPAAPAEVGQTARYMIQQLLGQVGQAEPDQAETGQTSGHGLAVANDLERAAQRQIPEGVREAVEFVAESILEIVDAIRRKHGVNVGLWVNEELEPGADVQGESSSRWRILEIQERWIGGVYKVAAVFPKRGNLAEISLLSDLVARGQASMDDLMEARGKEQPQAEKAKIDAERILTGTPEGQLAALANALRWRGEAEKAAQLEAQLAGRLSQFGLPTAAMQGPAPSPGGGMPGTQPPDIAASVRGGIVAGQMGTASRIADARTQLGLGSQQPVGPVPGQNGAV